MRRSLLAALSTLALASLAATACSAPTDEEVEDTAGAVGTRNLTANDFGLRDKELVLTLDDGPGPRTAELAQWLANEDVPAVFFMVGKNAQANPQAVQRVAQIGAQSGGKIIVANHSMTHTTPLPKQGVDGSISEIMNADRVLASNIAASQSPLPNAVSFFRPPYGAFTSLGAANISRVNAAGAEKYVGPVFWDIGGELNDRFSADWACWGKVSVDRCADGYVAEAQTRKKGVILVHDVHNRTVDMLMGTGQANGRSLIKDLKNLGFRFVSLRAHDEAVTRYAQQQERLSRPTAVSIDANVTQSSGGRVVVDVKTQGATRVTAFWDNGIGAVSFNGDRTLDVTLQPGSHFLTVTGFDAENRQVAQQRYSVLVEAPIEEQSEEAKNEGGAACVNFSLLKPGMKFRFYDKKIACSDPLSWPVARVDECYRFKGTATAKSARLVGPGEWSVDFDLEMEAKVEGGGTTKDASKLTFVMDAQTGEIETGKRYARPGGAKDAPMVPGALDCQRGEWRGKLQYPTSRGNVEQDYLFRMLRSPQTGGRIDFQE